MLRALTFKELCTKKTLFIGDDELIVGERGPFPKAVSTFPELNCHSVADFEILNSRPMTPFTVTPGDIATYEKEVVPYWRGRTMRDRVFDQVPEKWKTAYQAGLFTEFMEQRAPGHTTLDGTIYRKGMLDFKVEIAHRIDALDYRSDPEASDKAEELKAMDIACDAAIVFAERHAALAEKNGCRNLRSPCAKQNLKKLRLSAAGSRPMPPKISGKRSRCTGSFTWAPSLN